MKRFHKIGITWMVCTSFFVLLNSPLLPGFQQNEVFAKEKSSKPKRKIAKQKQKKVNAEEIDVNKIKKKYWARGNKSKIGVVQNRIYSKAKRFNLGVLGGVNFVDPFLTVNQAGFTLGYHFDEFWGLNLIGWKSIAKGSSALDAVNKELTVNVNVNRPQAYFGAEGTASFIYGKLSLFGSSIVYYDLYFIGGLGLMDTENGNYISPSVGIGQRFFMSKKTALRVDYRLMYYKEDIVESEITTNLGNVVGTRNTFSNTINLGFDFFF